jgi:signal transduction histidine kinase
MAESLERARALEQQFLLSVSHDLRTPLTSIRGYAEAISDGAGDPARAAAVISSEARRLERLVADLLDLAKLQTSSFSLRLEPVDLGQLAAVAVEGFEPDAAERGLMIRALGSGLPLPVSADHDRLGQVAANLIENAMKYSPDGQSVEITLDNLGTELLFTVRDHGPGIPPELQSEIFKPFHTSKAHGTGLGLAITQKLVDAHRGQLELSSEPGLYAELTVTLPVNKNALTSSAGA